MDRSSLKKLFEKSTQILLFSIMNEEITEFLDIDNEDYVIVEKYNGFFKFEKLKEVKQISDPRNIFFLSLITTQAHVVCSTSRVKVDSLLEFDITDDFDPSERVLNNVEFLSIIVKLLNEELIKIIHGKTIDSLQLFLVESKYRNGKSEIEKMFN
jgi:hypothetical protein